MVSGPIAAGAQEPEPVDGFVESDGFEFAEDDWFAFADDDWLGLEDGDVPDSIDDPFFDFGDGSAPEVTFTPQLSGCDASPQLSVTVAITAENALEYVWLSGMVSDEWMDRELDFESGATTLEYTETFELSADEGSWWGWNNVWLSVDVGDVNGNWGWDYIDVIYDLDDCTLTDFDEWIDADGAEVSDGSITLSECALSPKLTVSYTASDPYAIEEAWLSVYDQYYDTVAGFGYQSSTDFDAGATEITVSEVIDVQELRESGRDYVEVLFIVHGNGWWDGSSFSTLELDFDACTATAVDPRPMLTGGDGLAPEVEVTSIAVSQCDATPVVSIGYTVTDPDGIAAIIPYAYFMTDSGDDFQEPEVYFEADATEVSLVTNFEARIAEGFDAFVVVTDSADTGGNLSLRITVDSTDCTVEYSDLEDYWSEKQLDYPSIAVDSVSMENCGDTDTVPVVSVGYDISDQAGISKAGIELDFHGLMDLVRPGSEAEVTEVSGFEKYPVVASGDYYVHLEATNVNGYTTLYSVEISVDFDSCQAEITNVWD